MKSKKTSGATHYRGKKIEVIDVLEAFDLNRNMSNVVKYALRKGKKDDPNLEVEKMIDYAWRERYGTWAPLPGRTKDK